MMMAIQKILLFVSKFVVGVWDGLDESEISRPEILFQSAPGSTGIFVAIAKNTLYGSKLSIFL